jgi:tetratricopeptide (TPR) repeat protein/2-polyprenyl-3-methyl-5-hydroxy-6-metoxy-1,4-benzoquinol methylase
MNRKDRRAAGRQAGARGSPASDGAGLFALAVRHHQAGQLLEAENLYRQAIAIDRNHFGSLHHLGIIGLQRGQPQAALEVLGRAIAINDRVPDCHYNLAFALQALGRLNEAARHYQLATRLKPDYVDAHMNLGNVLKRLGKLGDAAGSYERAIALKPSAEAHYNLANVLPQLGRSDEAVSHYQRALALKPDFVGAHNNLANVLAAQGRSDEALSHFQRALELDPNLVEAHVNVGTTLLQQGKVDAAAAQFERALGINADFADAHANLGNVFLARGRLDEAAEHFKRALALKPELVEAHNNLGIVLAAQGAYDQASRQFQLALAGKPDFIDAYNNLARAFLSVGQPDSALGALRHSLAISETQDTKALFVQSVKALTLAPEDFRSLLVRALSEPWGRPGDLAPVAARLVKQDSALRPYVTRAMEAWPRRLPAEELLGPSGFAALCGHRLLRALMEATCIGDVELERLLTATRSALLEIASVEDTPARIGAEHADILDFCCALARQCFLNERAFACTEDELREAQRLRDQLLASLATDAAVSELQLAVIACYFPLHSLPGAETLVQRGWSDAITAVLVQQVREPAQERQLRASIPALTAIEDEVSRQVRRQYEENPYPRWEKTEPPAQPFLFDQYLRRRMPAAVFRNLDKPRIDILIAGCGTGQHAIETAQRFAGADVLAVDLSVTSLAYAKRKALALGLAQIEYGQADILKLASLGRAFDLVESSGVLHHLADPFAGWRALLALLRPGGFMAIGLYSEIARADIVAARAFIAERGYPSTAEGIRQCRQDILDNGARFKSVIGSGDFFSTSNCRDLLFHVQEHRLTIPQIAHFVADHGLAFVGFDLDHLTAQRYRTRFPDDRTMTDLAAWDVFEREHPSTFAGMYQFWVQKT